MRKLPTKGDLLEHYAEKTPHAFAQYDGFTDGEGDLTGPDGKGISRGLTCELMTGANVRVLISPETPYIDALRLLKKIRKLIKREGLLVAHFPSEEDGIPSEEDRLPF